MDHFLTWKAEERFFTEFFDPSSITRAGVIFVFAFLFLTLFLLIAVVFVINYGLECFANLDISYIYHSAHILFEYKLVLVILKLGVQTFTSVLHTK